jgi:mannose-1-phosphate guanylyltransferase
VEDGLLYGFHQDGYWIDIGTPERYLEATYDLLSGRVKSTLPSRDETGSLVYEPALIAGAHIGPQTVLGPHCSVGAESSVERSVLHDRVSVGTRCTIREAVLGEGVRVGDDAEIEEGAMLGSGVVVESGEVVQAHARIEPDAKVG